MHSIWYYIHAYILQTTSSSLNDGSHRLTRNALSIRGCCLQTFEKDPCIVTVNERYTAGLADVQHTKIRMAPSFNEILVEERFNFLDYIGTASGMHGMSNTKYNSLLAEYPLHSYFWSGATCHVWITREEVVSNSPLPICSYCVCLSRKIAPDYLSKMYVQGSSSALVPSS